MQGGGRRRDDALVDAELDQRRILLERGAEEDFAGKEQDDELRRGIELLPVRLAAEGDHVVAHLPRVVGEAGALRRFVGGFERVEVRGDGRLGVDHDALAAGQPHDEVGAQAPVFGRARFLLDEVAVVHHARHLDYALELDLAPAAPHCRRAQRS